MKKYCIVLSLVLHRTVRWEVFHRTSELQLRAYNICISIHIMFILMSPFISFLFPLACIFLPTFLQSGLENVLQQRWWYQLVNLTSAFFYPLVGMDSRQKYKKNAPILVVAVIFVGSLCCTMISLWCLNSYVYGCGDDDDQIVKRLSYQESVLCLCNWQRSKPL